MAGTSNRRTRLDRRKSPAPAPARALAFQELTGPPGTPSNPGAGTGPGPGAPGPARAPPTAGGQGAVPRAGEAAASRAPYLLHFDRQVHVGGSEVPSPVRDLTSGLVRPPAPPRVLWGPTAVRRRYRSHSSRALKLPLPSPRQPACSGDREQRGPHSQWQPGSAGQPPITERLTHLEARARRWQGEGRGRVRGGAPTRAPGYRPWAPRRRWASVLSL